MVDDKTTRGPQVRNRHHSFDISLAVWDYLPLIPSKPLNPIQSTSIWLGRVPNKLNEGL